MINKEAKKVFLNINSKLTYSKRYVSFKSNQSRHFLKNIPFSLAGRICMTAEIHSLKEIDSKKLKRILLEQHYSERIAKPSINKALKISQNELKKCKGTRKKENLTFHFKL